MTIYDFLKKLNELGIVLNAVDGQLDIDAPKGVLTDDIINNLKKYKTELIELIKKSRPRLDEKIYPVEKSEYYDVSHAQKRLWILNQLDEDGTAYNIPAAYILKGDISRTAFKSVFKDLVNRHESLRTQFISVDGIPKQVITDNKFKLEYIDLSNEKNSKKVAQKYAKKETEEPFDLEKDSLFRAKLLYLGGEEYALLFTMHHIIADGWSIAILINEVLELYNAAINGNTKDLEPLDIQYKDFSVWQNQYLNSESVMESRNYWNNLFSDKVEPLIMPSDFNRPSIQSYEGDHFEFSFGGDLIAHLKEIGERYNVSLFMVLLAGFYAILSRYSNQKDIVIGSPTAGRVHQDLEGLIGFFVNTLALRIRTDESTSFNSLLYQIKETTLSAFEHQKYPFDKLVEDLDLEKDLSRSALFDVMFALQNVNDISTKTTSVDNIDVESMNNDDKTSKFDISLTAYEGKDKLYFDIEYCTKLFKKDSIKRFAKHYETLLDKLVRNENEKIIDLDFLSVAEKEELLDSFNNKKINYSSSRTILDLFDEQVAAKPDQAALIFEDIKISYYELNEKANQLAHYIIENYQPEKNDLIGLILERDEWMIISVLAVLKTGAAYLPIDPDYPDDRKSYMIKNSESVLNIANEKSLFPGNAELINSKSIFLDETTVTIIERCKKSNPDTIISKNDLAYVIYTSGSTGLPKGVMVEHQNLIHIAESWRIEYCLNEFDVNLLQLASFSFDVFFGDLCRALLNGGTLIICPKDLKLDLQLLYNLIKKYAVSIFEATPAMIFPLMDFIYENALDISFLKLLILGSDTCPSPEFGKLCERYQEKIRIINSYGTTETTIDSSFYENKELNVINTSTIPIGKPMGNTRFYVLNENLRQVPVNVYGELCIAGPGISRGYLNNENLTEEKFVQDPFYKGQKMYRTGDLVKWLADGNVSFLGRKDNQVKIRGYRIELGEIDYALLNHKEIKDAVTIVAGTSEKEIISCIVPNGEIDENEIKISLRKQLTEFMIPSRIITLDKIPLTENGKVNRNKLIEIGLSELETEKELILPSNKEEERLLTLWHQVLNRKEISVNSNFFSLGGHSLKAMKLVSLIEKTFSVETGIKAIFEYPTIIDFAKYLKDLKPTHFKHIKPLKSAEYYDLSHAQKRLWVLDNLSEGKAAYNMSEVHTISRPLSYKILDKAFQEIIQRHEVLRTNIIMVEGEPKQLIRDTGIKINYSSLEEDDDPNGKLKKIIEAETLLPFNLESDRLLRVNLIRLGLEKHTIIITMHHIVSDAWSIDIMLKEILEVYDAIENQRSAELAKLPIQYKDYSSWHNKLLETNNVRGLEDYWLKQFEDFDNVLDLPTDFSRPPVKTFNGSSVSLVIDSELHQMLSELAKEKDITLFMLMLGAYYILLSKHCNQEDITIGTPIAGREHPDIENLIGFFVNTLALRINCSAYSMIDELLDLIKKTTINAYEHQLYPFDLLIENLKLDKDLSRSPLLEVFFTMQNINLDGDVESLNLSKPEIENFRSTKSKFDITLDVFEHHQGMNIYIEYNTDLFKETTIERFANHYINILKTMVRNIKQELKSIDILAEAERQKILTDFVKKNDSVEIPRLTVIELFEEQVEKTPEKPALVFQNRVLTYRELNEKANQLARFLISENELEADDIIALYMDRSEWLLISILGVLKTGAAYLPIDSNYPADRVNYMIEDSESKLILIDSNEKLKTLNEAGSLAININLQKQQIEKQPKENLKIRSGMNDLVYSIYTSGSTGKPKGALLENLGVANMGLSLVRSFDITNNDNVLQYASIGFDASIFEILMALLGGATLHIINDEMRYSVRDLENYICDQKITVAALTPTLCLNLSPDKISSMRLLISVGEEFKPELINSSGNIKYINAYGPTEASVCSTVYKIPGDKHLEKVPIGFPIDNLKAYIVDTDMNLAPIGVIGELAVAGIAVGRGYKNRPELNSEKFIDNPFSQDKYDKRMYLTGDLVKYLEDGSIIYLGRKDDQVKVNGNRLELGEIEKILLQHEEIKNAYVTLYQKKDKNKELIVYYVSLSSIDSSVLREHLSQHLPLAVVPSYYVAVEEIPLTVNGKIDKKALPEIDDSQLSVSEFEEAVTEMQRSLVEIWKIVLSRESISINDNFFELGGHSLSAIKVMAMITDKINVSISIVDIFKYLTIKELANYIDNCKNTKQIVTNIPVAENQDFYDATNAQKRLWVLDKFEGGSEAYHISASREVDDDIDIDIFKQTIQDLIRKYEILRTVFISDNGNIKQKILSPENFGFNVEYYDLSKESNPKELLDNYAVKNEIDRFDLEKGPLFRISLIKMADSKYVVLFTIHHIISDGWSMEVLVNDYFKFYQRNTGEKVELAEQLKIQYKDYSEWLKSELNSTSNQTKHREYWLKQLDGELPVLDFPNDMPRPVIQQFNGEAYSFFIHRDKFTALRTMAVKNNSTMFMLMLALVNTLIYKYTSDKDIIIGSPVTGRVHKDLHEQIGLFVNTLPYRNRFKAENTFNELLSIVSSNVTTAMSHELYPFDLMLNELDIKRDVSRSALFDIMLSYTAMSDKQKGYQQDYEQDPKVKSLKDKFVVSKFDLEFEIFEMPNGDLQIDIVYDTALFLESRIRNIAGHMQTIIDTVIETNGNIYLKSLSLLNAKEKYQFINQINMLDQNYDCKNTVIKLFEEQVSISPDNHALTFKNTKLTYKELNHEANKVAHYIRNNIESKYIPLYMNRSEKMIIALLGVLKSGIAYIPVDPEYPVERLNHILKSSGSNSVLMNQDLARNLNLDKKNYQIKIIEDILSKENMAMENPDANYDGKDLAYLMYTSGSTGLPKGVLIEHHSLADYCQTVSEYFRLQDNDVVLQQASLSFDTSIEEIFPALCSGASLIITEDGGKNIEELEKLISNHKVSFLSSTPLVLNELNKKASFLDSLKIIISGGDKLLSSQINNLYKSKATLYNTYGPTESTVCASYHKITDLSDPIPIGKAIKNRNVFILDEYNNIVPPGLKGQICIAGSGLAAGYTDDSNNANFIDNPYSLSEFDKKLYLTGDQATFMDDGSILFLGRIDEQLKINGYRVEPAEVEKVLLANELIEDTVVFAIGEKNKTLVACIQKVKNEELNNKKIRNYLSDLLPHYMIPSRSIILESFPQNTNGKVDLKKLKEIANADISGESKYVAAETDIEKELVKIWEEVLGKKEIGVNDNLFELGGNSITAVQIISKIQNHFAVKLELKSIFTSQNIRDIAEEVDLLLWSQNSEVQEGGDEEYII